MRKLLCALLLCLAVLPVVVSADSGPKPTLTITVQNAPEGTYYLDLLIPESERGTYDNLRERPYDNNLLEPLHALEGQGWYPAFAGGAKAPLFGDLTPGEDGTHRFTYFGLPKTFLIALSSQSGDEVTFRSTDQPFTRTAFYTNLVYDYATNTITAATSSALVRVVQVLSTLAPTLLVEGLILILFGFKLKENWLVLVVTNVVTQVGLHLAAGGGLIGMGGHFMAYFIMLLLPELLIWLLEAAAFACLLRGQSRGRRVGYAFAANAASFLVSFLPLAPMLTLIQRM